MAELLIEIRADVFDPESLPRASVALREALVRELRAVGLAPRQAAIAGTGRRIVILLRDLRPSAAGAQHPEEPDEPPAVDPRELARGAVQRAFDGCRWPWDEDRARAARWRGTVRGLLALYDDVPLAVEAFGLAARPESVGHPTLSPLPFAVEGAEAYRAELQRLGIEVRIPERRRMLRDRLFAAASSAGAELEEDAALLDVVAAGCEIAGVVVGALELEHLALPRELLATALRDRLQAFLLRVDGKLVPRFLAVIDRADDPDGRAARGVSWTASALLHDLAFHWQRDRGVPLAQRARELEAEPSRAAPGTWGQRSERLEALVRELGAEWGWEEEVEKACEAVRLLEAGAGTSLGRELPELGGVIAGLLAREDGYPDAVWQAIYDHGHPSTGVSVMPRGRCGTLVVCAHWIDRLAGEAVATAGSATEAPRESLDDIAQSRQAAGALLRVALHRGLPIDIRFLAVRALRRYRAQGFDIENAVPSLTALLEAAAESLFREEGFADEQVAAVLGASASPLLSDVQARLRAVRDLCRDPDRSARLAPLVRTGRRLEAMLRDAPDERLDVRLLSTEEEKDVFVSLQASSRRGAGLAGGAMSGAWLEHMERLDAALHELLRHVLVRDLDEPLRRNRIALLQEARRLYTSEVRLADLLGADDATGAGV
jgi:glycyl-tRNA synthetase beta chain